MKTIAIHEMSTWPPELIAIVDEIISINNLVDNDFDLNSLSIEASQYHHLEVYLHNHCEISFWHTSRLLNREIESIRKYGLFPLNDKLIEDKIEVLRDLLNSRVSQSTLTKIVSEFKDISKGQERFNCLSARDSFEQVFSPMNIQTLSFWGGEALLRACEKLGLASDVLIIGEPILIKISLPYSIFQGNVHTRSIPKSLIVTRGGNSEYSSVIINKVIQPECLSISNFYL